MAEFLAPSWYLFLYREPNEGAQQVLMASWEERLMQFIQSVPEDDRQCLYRVELSPTRLTFRVVRALWRPAPREESETLLVLIAIDDGSQGKPVPLDRFLNPVSQEDVGELVYVAKGYQP